MWIAHVLMAPLAFAGFALRDRKFKNIELPYDSAIPLLGIYPEKTLIRKDPCTPVFIAALFIDTIART